MLEELWKRTSSELPKTLRLRTHHKIQIWWIANLLGFAAGLITAVLGWQAGGDAEALVLWSWMQMGVTVLCVVIVGLLAWILGKTSNEQERRMEQWEAPAEARPVAPSEPRTPEPGWIRVKTR